MTEHLGGPESAEQIAERHGRFTRLAASGKGRWFKIVDEATGESVGSVGYWERVWRDQEVYETRLHPGEECEFEYPKGSFMQCNDWRLDLTGR
jgi:hypothetical protein